MNIIICGTVVPPKYELQIEELSNAGNRFQLNLIDALKERGQKIRVVSYIGINVPEKVKRCLQSRKEGDRYIFRAGSRVVGTARLNRKLKKCMDSADWIVAYNPIYAWLFLPLVAFRANVKSGLILADFSPPESYDNLIMKVYALLQMASIRKYNLVIGLSENVKKYLKKEQKFVCIEGGISRSVYDYFERYKVEDKDKKIFMYAGLLEPANGVENLIKAFGMLESKNSELWISGKGSLKYKIIEASDSDPRIKYLGCLPYKEYLDCLSRADILVNPRDMSLPENANNFPSKIMEYIATGKKIISTKFPGYRRFRSSVQFCENSVIGIAKAMQDVAEIEGRMQDWEARRKKGKAYLWSAQAGKMIEAMKECT